MMYTKFISLCLNLQQLSFVIEKITLVKTLKVAGKLPLSLNQSSPKLTDLEYLQLQERMQKII